VKRKVHVEGQLYLRLLRLQAWKQPVIEDVLDILQVITREDEAG
jgi:hypothetical protein